MKTHVVGLLNLTIVIFLAIPIAVLRFSVDPVKRGFFCNDEDLAHPLQESTVSSSVLVIVGVGLPIALIVILELLIPRSKTQQSKQQRSMAIFFILVDQLFGVGVTVLLTDIAKYTIGRLR